MSINKGVKMWIGDTAPATECHFAQQICFAFNIPCLPFRCHVRMKVSKLGKNFLEWLKEFVQKNNINFPYAETFFSVLIYNSLKDDDITENTSYDDARPAIMKASNKISQILSENDCMDSEIGQSRDQSMLPSATDYTHQPKSPVFKHPLFPFKGEIWFERLDEDSKGYGMSQEPY